jgi:hypothetical protein
MSCSAYLNHQEDAQGGVYEWAAETMHICGGAAAVAASIDSLTDLSWVTRSEALSLVVRPTKYNIEITSYEALNKRRRTCKSRLPSSKAATLFHSW